MMSISKENLDERIERIKRQTEEIEKKHREAEEDRLMALKMNALVTKPILDDENWPKAHKYDELDFTYDVDPEKLQESNKAKEEERFKSKRDYKKFAEGEGPPPDPKYNFLADIERDGTSGQQVSHKNDKFKQNYNNTISKNKEQYHKRNGSQNNSFRGGRGNKGQQQSQNLNKSQARTSQPEQWRSNNDKGNGEDLKVSNNRNPNQKTNEKWKKEWDNDKTDKHDSLYESHNSNRSPKHAAKNISNYQNQSLINIQQNHLVLQSGSNNSYSQAEYMIEKRGNITVSVSQTGEVKSVKLSSAPAIGTGRVGPRQLSKTSFQVQTKTAQDDGPQTQFKLNSNNKLKNENKECLNNTPCANLGGGVYIETKPLTPELQKIQLQNLLQQHNQIEQQQLLLQQQSQPISTQQQNFPTKSSSVNVDVSKVSQNQLLQQSKQELVLQKQREQLQQQQQQQIEQQLLQRHKDQVLQFSLLEQQQKHQQKKNEQQQDQLKHQILIQQLHQQQQKEFMQQRQSLLKQQKQQQQMQSQSSAGMVLDSHIQLNEYEKSVAKNLIKSPKKDKKNLKNNDLPSKIMNSHRTVGVLQMTEVNNSQNVASTIMDPNVLNTVAKELSNKPEFAKKSVQDRLLRIRQNSNVNNLNSEISEATSIDDNTLNSLAITVKINDKLTEVETVTCK